MMPPGARRIPDAEAEMERLAAARQSPAPNPDTWTVETVERIRITHLATGKYAEAPTCDEALGKLVMELVQCGDITINDARKAHGLPPFGAFS
jgi:hypothetical protein